MRKRHFADFTAFYHTLGLVPDIISFRASPQAPAPHRLVLIHSLNRPVYLIACSLGLAGWAAARVFTSLLKQ